MAKLKPIKVCFASSSILVTFICHLSNICQPITFFKHLIQKTARMYNVFGSGASHGIHAQFIEQSKEHNGGRALNLLRGTDVRMAC